MYVNVSEKKEYLTIIYIKIPFLEQVLGNLFLYYVCIFVVKYQFYFFLIIFLSSLKQF